MAPQMAPALRLIDAVSAGGVGLVLAFFYDVLHLFAGRGKLRLFVCDVLTFAAAAVLLVSFSLSKTYSGQLRWYMVAGALAGFLAFRQLVSPVLASVARGAAWLFCLPGRLFCRYVLRPIGVLLHKTFLQLSQKAAQHRKKRKKKPRRTKHRVLYDSGPGP